MKKLVAIQTKIIFLFCLYPLFNLFLCSPRISQNTTIVNKTITLKILLVEFKDVKHRSLSYPEKLSLPSYTYDDFYNMFFSENKYCSPNMYSPDGKEVFGSLRDYYRIMSNNNLLLSGYVLNNDDNNDNVPDWITLDNSKSYYHNNKGDQFRLEAKNKAKSFGLDISIDNSTFLVIIYAGHTYRKAKNTLNPEAFFNEREYIMGERFASSAPYEVERDDPTINQVAHFSHIGIHAHELCHLLGFSDQLGGCDNKRLSLMSSGNFNGPNNEGACPAPINPYFRFKLGWVSFKSFGKTYTATLNYNILDPEVFILRDDCSNDFFLLEYRKFNSKIALGDYSVDDYNTHVKNVRVKHGLLIWRKLTGDFLKLMHPGGNESLTSEHLIFSNKIKSKVITPWSDTRETRAGYYWVPNTKPSNNCGIEIKSCDENNCIVDLYQKFPERASPSRPKKLISTDDQHVSIRWEKNMEPDLAYYKIYKKINEMEYDLYDSTSKNNYVDINERIIRTDDTSNYAYYKITSFDNENKESTFSDEIKLAIEHGNFTSGVKKEKITDRYILEQNYPNPFNPSTKIRYTITQGANINLKVYDILGNLVDVLVNETKMAGSYEVVFNLEENKKIYSSGVYIFKFSADNYLAIKKGLLLK